MITTYNNLSLEQKVRYREYCNKKYGVTFTFSEDGEPLYFDEEFRIIDTSLIIDLLFSVNNN